MSGTPEPFVCIDSTTGREVYAPTGETIDQVLTVVATPLPPDEDAGLAATQTGPTDAVRWGLVAALLAVSLCAGLARRFSRASA